MRAQFINLNEGYWSGDSDLQNEYEDYYSQLVPSMGEADTIQGELLRNISRVAYDYYNNGFGNDKSDEMEFLKNNSSKFLQFMKDPKNFKRFDDIYSEIYYGSWEELEKKAQEEYQEYQEASRYSTRGYGYGYGDEEDEWEESYEDYLIDINDVIKPQSKNIERYLEDITDGIVKYIRLTDNKLEPLHK